MMTRLVIIAWLALCSVANAQLAGGLQFPGPGTAHAVVTYQGPGDVVSGAGIWGSCARVYSVAQASTSTSLCDLVAITGGAAVCTLRGSNTGFVDLAASYCAGTTPAAACAAASGGSCKVTKIYDQAGATGGWIQATLASMPTITFAGLNSLPGVDCTGGTNAVLQTSGSVAASQPFTYSTVYRSNTTSGGGLSGGAGGGTDSAISATNGLFGIGVAGANTFTIAATNNVYHAAQALSATGVNGSVLNLDGSEATGTYANALTTASRFCRSGSGGGTLVGIIMELGIWTATGFDGTQRGDMNTNQHSLANGYNF